MSACLRPPETNRGGRNSRAIKTELNLEGRTSEFIYLKLYLLPLPSPLHRPTRGALARIANFIFAGFSGGEGKEEERETERERRHLEAAAARDAIIL